MGTPFDTQGAFSWTELMTSDVDKAKKFYTELLGWKTEDMPMQGGTYTVLKAGEEKVGGMLSMPFEVEGMPPMWGAYVTVEDVDTTAKKAQELGATTVVPPTDIPGVGRFCTFRDPQGATISVITYEDK